MSVFWSSVLDGILVGLATWWGIQWGRKRGRGEGYRQGYDEGWFACLRSVQAREAAERAKLQRKTLNLRKESTHEGPEL